MSEHEGKTNKVEIPKDTQSKYFLKWPFEAGTLKSINFIHLKLLLHFLWLALIKIIIQLKW